MTCNPPAQAALPGLLGMASVTDAVYLASLHKQANARRGKQLNWLRFHYFGLDFSRLVDHLRAGDFRQAEDMVVDGVDRLAAAGASFGVITSNTGSSLAEAAGDRIALPLLSIADVTCKGAQSAGHRRLGLLSTIRTSDSGVYHRAGDRAGIEIMSPGPDIAVSIERLIFEELIFGSITDAGLALVADSVAWFARQGADSVTFACTDLTHLVPALEPRSALPIFDSTLLHARAAADMAIDGSAA